jgi:GTP-dependent phosphoenolpyruvate carboxykinase
MTLPADKAEEVVDTTKTDKTVVNDDLSDEELEQIAEERARIDEQKAIEKKNSTKSYIQQLREEKAAEKARADAAEERELNLKKQGEFDVACATF